MPQPLCPGRRPRGATTKDSWGLPCHYCHVFVVAGDLVLSIDRGRVSTAALIDHVLERAPGTEGVGARADVAT